MIGPPKKSGAQCPLGGGYPPQSTEVLLQINRTSVRSRGASHPPPGRAGAQKGEIKREGQMAWAREETDAQLRATLSSWYQRRRYRPTTITHHRSHSVRASIHAN